MKKTGKFIFSFLVNSNIWIALGAVAWIELVLMFENIAERPVAAELLVFAATLLIYNLHRLITVPDKEANTLLNMHRWMQTHSILQKILMAFSAIAVAVTAFFLDEHSLFLLAAVGLISFFYAVPIPYTKGFRLRDVGLLKPVFVSIVWAAVCVVLPMLSLQIMNDNVVLLAVHCFLFFMAITIPFDIRDLQFDEKNLRYRTLPMLIGINVTKMIALVFHLLSGILLWKIKPGFETGIISWYALTAFLLLITKKNSSEYHYTFWLDGTLVMGYMIMMFGKYV